MSEQLRVLHVNHADLGHGGAGVSPYRLHRSLIDHGVDSRMRLGHATVNDGLVLPVPERRWARRLLRPVGQRLGLNDLDGLGAYSIRRVPDYRSADVVHFHALEGYYFSYPAIPLLTRSKPAVMTLHDMWPFTGHCSFSLECERWLTGCGKCPHPEMFPAIRRDATRLEHRMKRAVWRTSRLVVLSPSEWLARLARRSMLARFDVRVIPHGLDTAVFAPRDQAAARAALGISSGDVVLMFAAASLADARKGADLLLAALRAIRREVASRCTVLVMGNLGPGFAEPLRAAGFRFVDMQYILSDRLKAAVYSAADMFVFPTRAENSPLVVLEAMACGTPVVSFDVGGIGELVRHGRTGLLVPPEDVDGLSSAITQLIENPDSRARMRVSCRELIEAEYTNELAATRHADLYRELVGRTREG